MCTFNCNSRLIYTLARCVIIERTNLNICSDPKAWHRRIRALMFCGLYLSSSVSGNDMRNEGRDSWRQCTRVTSNHSSKNNADLTKISNHSAIWRHWLTTRVWPLFVIRLLNGRYDLRYLLKAQGDGFEVGENGMYWPFCDVAILYRYQIEIKAKSGPLLLST